MTDQVTINNPTSSVTVAIAGVQGVQGLPGNGSNAASDISVVPAGGIASTDVQSALEEIDTEKETPAGAQSKIDLTFPNQSGTVTTLNATPTAVISLPLTDDSIYHVKALVVGKKDDFSQGSSYEISATAYRVGAGASILGSVTSLHAQEGGASWDASFDVSGNNLLVVVTGKAATTIGWKSLLTWIKI